MPAIGSAGRPPRRDALAAFFRSASGYILYKNRIFVNTRRRANDRAIRPATQNRAGRPCRGPPSAARQGSSHPSPNQKGRRVATFSLWWRRGVPVTQEASLLLGNLSCVQSPTTKNLFLGIFSSVQKRASFRCVLTIPSSPPKKGALRHPFLVESNLICSNSKPEKRYV